MRLRQIDETNRSDHSHIRESDTCFFLHEYTKGLSWKDSAITNLVQNLKRDPSYRDKPAWRHKLRTIDEVGRDLAGALTREWLELATLVPIPPSKTPTHSSYDDRITQVLLAIRRHSGVQCDIRELLMQTVDKEASHTRDERRDIERLIADYQIQESLVNPPPKQIGVFDDMLTTGAHYRAAIAVLGGRFPGIPIVGIFVTRRIIPEVEINWGNDFSPI